MAVVVLTLVLAQGAAGERFAGSTAVTITGADTGFSFGSRGSGLSDGRLWWRMVDGAPSPLLEGTLHLAGVRGSCARMKLDYLATSGVALTTKYGGVVCASSDNHHRFSVSLQPYTSSKIGQVRVTVQHRLVAATTWTGAGSQTLRFRRFADPVKITEDGLDFGSEGFLGSGPTGSGTLIWRYETGRVHARLQGIVHLNNVAGVCARMKVDHLAAGGALLGRDEGETVCARDNRHYRWRIDLGSFSHRDTVKANVSLQTLGSDDVWRNAGRAFVWFSKRVDSRTRLASG